MQTHDKVVYSLLAYKIQVLCVQIPCGVDIIPILQFANGFFDVQFV